MTATKPPFEHFYDLRDLGQAGARVTVAAKGDELARLAHWAEVEAVESFAAQVDIKKLATTRFEIAAHLEAEIVQACVVTLEPVRTKIGRDFTRELHYVSRAYREKEAPAPLTLAAGEDEAPEEIASLNYDLAAPLLEEFTLGIDPYPRAPGVAFEAKPDEAGAEDSPFAVLKALKER